MLIQFQFFPDDEEAPVHNLTFDLPGVPEVGDVVTVARSAQEGYTNYVVRRRQWDLEFPDDKPAHRAGEVIIGATAAVIVECNFVVGSYASEEHKPAAPCLPLLRS